MFTFLKKYNTDVNINKEIEPSSNSINYTDNKLQFSINNQKLSLDKLKRNLNYTGFSLDNLKNITEDIFKSIDEQDSIIENVFQEITNYSALAEEVIASTTESKSIASSTLDTAHSGNSAVTNTINSMNNIQESVEVAQNIIDTLSEKSNEISSMLDITKNIAKQTKLLSFNASIEASRAGEYGKGFSIVAQEINKLALNSNESADEISKTILSMKDSIVESKTAMEKCIEKVEEGTEVSNKTLEVFNNIIEAVGESNEIFNTISDAITQQTGALNNIIASAESLKDHSNTVSSLIEWMGLNTKYTETTLQALENVCSNLEKNSNKILSTISSSCKEETSLNVFLNGNAIKEDPIHTVDQVTCEVNTCIHNSLLSMSGNGDLLPAIAKSWTLSNDGLTWTFNIRKNSYFHNMEEVTAEDIKYSLERLLDPNNKCTNAYFLKDITGATEFMNKSCKEVKGIKILNRYCFSIELSTSYSGILFNLAHCCCSIICKKSYLNNKSIIGCGPFYLEKLSKDSNTGKLFIHLKAFRDYFGGSPYIDNLYFKNCKDNIIDDFLKNEIQIIKTDKYEIFNKLQCSNGFKLNKSPLLCAYYGGFVFNSKKPWSTNAEVRNAINHCIDRKKLIKEVFGGLATECPGPCPKGLIDSNLKSINYDLSYAKNIFSKHQVLSKEKNFKIAYFSGEDKITALIAEQLKQLGLNVTIKEESYNDFFNKNIIKNYDMFISSWYADTLNADSYISPLFATDADYNLGNYSNPEMERLLQYAKGIVNPSKKLAAFTEMEKTLMNDVPWVYLVSPELVYTCQPDIIGMVVNPLGMTAYENIMINK